MASTSKSPSPIVHYSHQENELLLKAYCTIKVLGHQKNNLWEDISTYYHDNISPSFPRRTLKSLKDHFSDIHVSLKEYDRFLNQVVEKDQLDQFNMHWHEIAELKMLDCGNPRLWNIKFLQLHMIAYDMCPSILD